MKDNYEHYFVVRGQIRDGIEVFEVEQNVAVDPDRPVWTGDSWERADVDAETDELLCDALRALLNAGDLLRDS